MMDMKRASSTGLGIMTSITRIAIALSSVLLAVSFVLPVWRIDLVAPQYPEGLGMLIRVNTITGVKPADLNNINGLNHYIGMKAIVPEAIPVLDAMPIVLGILVALGLVVALYGRRWAAWSWLGLVAAAGAAGIAEFYRWSYDYGHNLASDAIIKIPGMTYQPPLIGTKQLLNFTAASWPGPGGIAAGAAFVITLLALFFSRPRRKGVSEATLSTLSVAASIAIVAAVCAMLSPRNLAGQQKDTVVVSATSANLTAALSTVKTGGVIIVMPGRYRAHEVNVSRPVSIIGRGYPVLDGEGNGEILRVTSDGVTISGLTLTGTGVSYTQDRAAIRVSNVGNCSISNNRFVKVLYGIYLAKVTDCEILGNMLEASGKTEATSGNGIHLWSARGITIADNHVSGFRDGIYFEFVHNTEVSRNISEGNLRYGLHFMYSDDCEYTGNTFRHNGAGVAVMYTKRVHMVSNRFEKNWGSSAYGLLLKEIADSRIEHNVFEENTVGLYADGADRIRATGNDFNRNGWAVKVGGSTLDGLFVANNFVDNTFDVSTNSREPSTRFEGNYWNSYRGYDLDRDGVGDIPHAPVRLFSVIVEDSPQAIVLMRSALVTLLDFVERAMPSLTPEFFVDPKPSMRRLG
jgi:nitrous oxidase accessory protein